MAVRVLPLTRKKRVQDKYNPDTFRVISTEAEGLHITVPEGSVKLPIRDELMKEKPTPYLYGRETQVLPKNMPDYRAHRPHSEATDFLRRNVLLLNEPICDVHTAETQNEQANWWPSRTSDNPLQVPPYTVNTTFREDFRKHKPIVPGATRHSSNPNKEPSKGAVPVNFLRGSDGKQTLWKEGLSYEHQYNSRLDPSYPIRGKRHGAFVWDKMNPGDSQRFIDHYSSLAREEQELANKQCLQTSNSTQNGDVSWPVNCSSRETTHGQTVDVCQNNPVAQQESDSSSQRHQSVTMATNQETPANMPRVDD